MISPQELAQNYFLDIRDMSHFHLFIAACLQLSVPNNYSKER